MEAPPERLTCAALFAFDAEVDAAVGAIELRRVDPIAPVTPDDVLALAARVRWPDPSPIALALAAAYPSATDTSDPQTPEAQAGPWHPIPHQGIDGEVGGFNLLLGTAEFIEDAGIPVPDAARQVIERNTEQGWASVLVGACHRPSETKPARQSLIGILAMALRRASDSAQASAARAAWPALLANAEEEASQPADPDQPSRSHVAAWLGLRSRTRRVDRPSAGAAGLVARLVAAATGRAGRWVVGLAAVSAVVGVALSCMSVAPDEVALVRRFGRVVDRCGPGLHLRPLWPLENTIRFRPDAIRRLVVPMTPVGSAAAVDHWTIADLVLTGDTWREPGGRGIDPDMALAQAAERNASQMVQVEMEVRYGITDVEVFLFGVRDAEAIVAAEVESVMRGLIGSRSLATTAGPQRGQVADLGRRLVQARLDALACGVQVHGVMLTELRLPPDTSAVSLSEAEAGIARAESERLIALTRSLIERDRMLAEARVRAVDRVAAAEVESTRRVAEAVRIAEWVRARHNSFVPAAGEVGSTSSAAALKGVGCEAASGGKAEAASGAASQPAATGGPTP